MTFSEICSAAIKAFWTTLAASRNGEQAVKAFWQAVPKMPTGDFPADAAMRFDEAWNLAQSLGQSPFSEGAFEVAATDAIRTLMHFNLPTGTVIQLEDGFELHNVDGSYTDGDLTYSSIFKIDLDFTILSIPETPTVAPGDIVLPRHQISALLAAQDQNINPDSVCYYNSVEELAAKTASSKNWSAGEVFVYAPSPERYLVMCQIAPASCEMMTLSHNGFHDVLTAYRFSQPDLVATLNKYLNT